MPQTRLPVSLRRLFPSASFVGSGDIGVRSATCDSRECTPEMLFAAISGTRHDGGDFVTDAIDNGASALLVSRPNATVNVPQCVVPNVRTAWSVLCHAMNEFPTRRLHLTGVTGTNGKTTVCWLLRSIHAAADNQCGLLGTIEYDDGRSRAPAMLTTPDSGSLFDWISRMVANRCSHAAIELSSHALEQDRAAGASVNIGVITNITRDHFDYHGSAEAYRASKRRIADLVVPSGMLVVNSDSGPCREIGETFADSGRKTVTFGLTSPADVSGRIIAESLHETVFELSVAGQDAREVRTSLTGRHNVLNCLAAAAAAHEAGIAVDCIVDGIERVTVIPGRLQRVNCGQPFDAFVDYAHTGDALRNVVATLRPLSRGRMICVFGAGGERDKDKRPIMAQAVAEADVIVVTSDNPRSEEPQQIIDDIRAGFDEAADARAHFETSRAAAIRLAVTLAQPDDCVLVAGKGHETTQQIGTNDVPFDDRLVLHEAIIQSVQNTTSAPVRVGA